uniref:Uncharacterized protein n=1 Tax=Arion vulgaris TaxID=1028688 RepID=A0A0B6Z5G1_9EUPU
MEDTSDKQDAEGTEQIDQDQVDEMEQSDGFFLEDNAEGIQDLTSETLNQEAEEVALLDAEPADDDLEQQNDSSLLEENGALDDSEHKKGEDAPKEKSEGAESKAAGKKKSREDIKMEDAEFEGNDDDEDDAEENKNRDINEMPQVNVATLAKRKWQVKVYPLTPEDFVSGQISRVFSNARESLLYILSSGKYSGGKGEMYVSSGIQASRVVQNLMKLDFKSPTINIEIIKKNDEGVVEEKAFMRFDAKLVRILCVPLLPSRRMGSKRERIIGSVFVKNLPKGTSKDMLRVMFPFAPEINYNPEKFQDG